MRAGHFDRVFPCHNLPAPISQLTRITDMCHHTPGLFLGWAENQTRSLMQPQTLHSGTLPLASQQLAHQMFSINGIRQYAAF